MSLNYTKGNFFLFIALMFSFLYACKNDGPEIPPSRIYDLTIEGDSATAFLEMGEEIEITVNVQVPGERTVDFRVYRRVDSTEEELFDDTGNSESSNFRRVISYKVGNPQPQGNGVAAFTEMEGSDVWLRFEGRDQNNKPVEGRYHIVVRGGKVNDLGEITLYMLNSQNQNDTLNFVNTLTGETISPVDAIKNPVESSARIDFGYLYGPNEDEPTFTSIRNYPEIFLLEPLAPGNATIFRLTDLNIPKFLQLNLDDDRELIDAFLSGVRQPGAYDPPSSNITGFKVGDIIGFATDEQKEGGRKLGVLRVADYMPGADGKIVFEMKVQD